MKDIRGLKIHPTIDIKDAGKCMFTGFCQRGDKKGRILFVERKAKRKRGLRGMPGVRRRRKKTLSAFKNMLFLGRRRSLLKSEGRTVDG